MVPECIASESMAVYISLLFWNPLLSKTFFTHLRCSACERTLPGNVVQTVCPSCGKALVAEYDLVFVHVEAPDEAGHTGDLKNKLKAIEDFDEFIVGNIIHGMKQFDEYRILALPDHPTPIELRTHTTDPVPFVIYDNTKERKGGPVTYDEKIADRKDALVFKDGYTLMDYFLKK